MNDKMVKGILWGVSALIGIAVAEGLYRTGLTKIDDRNLIGDGEILSEELEESE